MSSTKNSTHILVTGASGFLGGAVMAQLIETPLWDSCLFLVRASSPEEGLARLVANLRRFSVPEAQLWRFALAQVICGDLGNVDDYAADERLTRVTHVINCAAIASFGKNPLIWATNVESTVAFAECLHAKARLQRFIHVGTAMVCGPEARSPVSETDDPGRDIRHLVEYTESKIEAERRLRALPGLPLVVARPSIVVGHTQLGCQPSGSIFWVFRMALAMGCFTCDFDERIDVIPVDYCANALLHLALKPQLANDLYHISSGPDDSCSFRQIDAAMAEATRRPRHDHYRRLGYDALAAMRPHFDDYFGRCNKRIMLRAIRTYGDFAELGLLFDNRRLLAEGMAPPLRFDRYVGLCAQTSGAQTIAEQMTVDFK
ncbi:MAG: NAD(P)H-binding protein [Candidatus Accumulibacter sp.]|nr:NAD(P)H-binding protein [Accumulibacter sp.]